MKSREEILSLAIPNDKMCGVYFLIKGNVILYVGQSTDIYSRFTKHKRMVDFDSYTIIECPQKELLKLEKLYIEKLNPPMNADGKERQKRKKLEVIE